MECLAVFDKYDNTFWSGLQDYIEYMTPHQLKSIAAGGLVVIAPLSMYTDDLSANKSKKWNKFDMWSVSLARLTKYEPRMFTNIQFVPCLNRLSALKMSGAIVEDLCMLEVGIRVYDCFL